VLLVIRLVVEGVTGVGAGEGVVASSVRRVSESGAVDG
jgi:hypothetical protein